MTTVTQVGTTHTNFADLNRLPTLQIGNYATPVSFAGHHVIPTAVFDASRFLGALQSAGLWDNNSFSQNGVPLPTNGPNGTIFNPETGMPRHAGSHPAYSDWVTRNLKALETAYSPRSTDHSKR
ncbi:MAG: AHH domain-containing protein [Hyphomicrobium sp.]